MSNLKLAIDIINGFNIGIIPVGTALNILTCVVSLRKPLRSMPTFIFIAVTSIVDITPLVIRYLDDSLNNFLGYYLRDLNEIYCKMSLFMHFFPLQTSAYLLIAMTVERYLSIKIHTWRKSLFNSKRAAVVCAVIATVFFLTNFYSNFSPFLSLKKIGNTNATRTVCNDGPFAAPMHLTSLYVFSMVPFGILLIFNCLFIYEILLKKKKNLERSEKDIAKRRSLSISVMALTIKYVIMTGPAPIVYGYLSTEIIQLSFGQVVFITASVLCFMHHYTGIFVLLATNKKFLDETRKVFGIKIKPAKKEQSTNNNTNLTAISQSVK